MCQIKSKNMDMEANINYLLKKLWLRREARSNTAKRWADSLPCPKEDSVGISSGCVIWAGSWKRETFWEVETEGWSDGICVSITCKTIQHLQFLRGRCSLGRTWQTPRWSFSWETNIPFSSQEIPHLLCISVLCSFIYASPVLNQIKPIHPLISYFLIICFNIVLPFTSRSLKLFLRSGFSDRYYI